jgi:predicted  nucleic acid-binding Zn-ribbon protein
MNPEFLAPLIPIAAIVAFTVIKLARLRASRPEALSGDVVARLEALEQGVHGLEQELADTQERLDFAERLLSQAREERRIGG